MYLYLHLDKFPPDTVLYQYDKKINTSRFVG